MHITTFAKQSRDENKIFFSTGYFPSASEKFYI